MAGQNLVTWIDTIRGMQDRRVDTISGPPDDTRPRNPWPRLILFGLGVLAALFLLGYCVAVFASPPPRELRVPLDGIERGLPLFRPVTTFGADRDGFTYGAWIAFDGNEVQAFLSRQPETLCNLAWNPTYLEDESSAEAGAFVDRCGDAVYTFNGEVIGESASKDLDVFPTRREGREIVVDIMRLHLGECREDDTEACAPAGETREIRVPRNALDPDFATTD